MSVAAFPMNRKRWVIAGITLVVLIVPCLIGLATLYGRVTGQSEDPGQRRPVSELRYCSEDQVKPCVVSFSLDADDNMLVNLLLPDLSFPNFYLQITHGEIIVSYECQRIVAAPNNAFCIGEKLPPGETLHLMLFSIKGDVLLAEGSLSIIGLAFPTMGVVSPTASMTPTTEPTPTIELDSTPTPTRTPTRSPTPRSYP